MQVVDTAQTETAINIASGEPAGCGWFDSSYELGEGLVVTEDFDRCVFTLWSELAPAQTMH